MPSVASENGGSGAEPSQTEQHVGLFDLRILIRELWRWKWLVVLAALIGVAIGINDVRNFRPTYEAQMLITPSEGAEFSTPATGAGGLVGAAQSFGLISVGATATSFDYFKQVIRSRSLADVLQEKHGLLRKIFKGSWNAADGTWIKPKIDGSSIRQRLRRFFHFNPPRVPNRGDLANFIGGAVRVTESLNSPFFKISVVHSDPEFAFFLLETVYKEADKLLVAKDRRKQKRNKEYLQAQLEKTQLKEVRNVLLGILMQIEQKAMLNSTESPYMINVLEKPWVVPQPKEPEVARIVGTPTAIAVIIILVVLVLFVSFRFE